MDVTLVNCILGRSLIVVRRERINRTSVSLLVYEGGPKYFRNLNLPHKRDIVQGSATRYGEPTIF
jgi:hypothetical protein